MYLSCHVLRLMLRAPLVFSCMLLIALSCKKKATPEFGVRSQESNEMNRNNEQWLDISKVYSDQLTTDIFNKSYPIITQGNVLLSKNGPDSGLHSLYTVAVRTSRVLLADYSLIKKDFPETTHWTHDRIDNWLIKQASRFTRGHVAFNEGYNGKRLVETKTDIPLAGKNDLGEKGGFMRCVALRPPSYGRALLFPLDPTLEDRCPDRTKPTLRFADVKGVGLTTAGASSASLGSIVTFRPEEADHANGLLETHAALREFVFEKAMAILLNAEDPRQQTLGSYAVVDWGFFVIDGSGQRSRAGAIIRRGNIRFGEKPEGFADQVKNSKIPLEMRLRTFGVTSAGMSIGQRNGIENVKGTLPCGVNDRSAIGAAENLNCDVINLQYTFRRELVDFGAFMVPGVFRFPVKTISVKRVIAPDSPEFARPEPKSLPTDIWGPIDELHPDPAVDRISTAFWNILHAEFADVVWDPSYETSFGKISNTMSSREALDWKTDEERMKVYDSGMRPLRIRYPRQSRGFENA